MIAVSSLTAPSTGEAAPAYRPRVARPEPTEWFVRTPADQEVGRFTRAELEREIAAGRVGPDHLVRHVEWPSFRRLGETPPWGGPVPRR